MSMTVITSQAKTIDLLDLDPLDINIKYIARCLSNTTRFNGGFLRSMSVAEHSVRVAQYAQTLTTTKHKETQALHALLHDAAEAYVGDLINPIKSHPAMEFYRNLEIEIQRKINEKYLPEDLFTSDIYPVICENTKIADEIIFKLEILEQQDPKIEQQYKNLYGEKYFSSTQTATDNAILFFNTNRLSPVQAEKTFMKTFEYLHQLTRSSFYQP